MDPAGSRSEYTPMPGREPVDHGSQPSLGEAHARPSPHYGPTAIVTLPNLITFGRAALLPLLFYLMLTPGATFAWAAFWLWVALAVSDTVDGTIARRLGPTTSGAYLDPLADKLQVIGALGVLYLRGAVSLVPLSLVVVRELAVSALRSIAARRGISIPATPFGKAKTTAQMVAVGLYLLPWLDGRSWIAEVVLWIAVGFTLASGLDYGWRGIRLLAAPKADAPPPDSGSLEGTFDPVLSVLLDREEFESRSQRGESLSGVEESSNTPGSGAGADQGGDETTKDGTLGVNVTRFRFRGDR